MVFLKVVVLDPNDLNQVILLAYNYLITPTTMELQQQEPHLWPCSFFPIHLINHYLLFPFLNFYRNSDYTMIVLVLTPMLHLDQKYGYGKRDCKGKDNQSFGTGFCRNTSLRPPLQLSAQKDFR